jgi:hypothetical protein
MSTPEQSLDVATITRDALLLDALGRSEPAPPDDPVAAMLAAWRADLGSPDLPESTAPAPVDPVPSVPAQSSAGSRPGATSRRSHRPSFRVRATVAAAAAVTAIAGALTIAAGDATPNSPLWPITQLLYPDRADSRVAEDNAQHAIDAARDALNQRQYTDAEHQLDEATDQIGLIREPTVAQRLLGQVAALRGMLPGASPPAPAGATPSAGPSGGTSDPSGPADPGGPGANPTATTGDGGLPLPPLPVPSLPALPLPSLPLLPLLDG